MNYKEFKKIINDDVVAKFPEIQNCIQKIKDEYYSYISESNSEMSTLHEELRTKVEDLIVEIKKYPVEPNADVLNRAQKLIDYASKRINGDVKIEYDVKCGNCGLTLSEMKAAIALIPNYTNSMLFIKSDIVKDAKEPKKKSNKKIHFTMPPRIMKAGEYRTWIIGCSDAIKDIPDDEEIEIEYKG